MVMGGGGTVVPVLVVVECPRDKSGSKVVEDGGTFMAEAVTVAEGAASDNNSVSGGGDGAGTDVEAEGAAGVGASEEMKPKADPAGVGAEVVEDVEVIVNPPNRDAPGSFPASLSTDGGTVGGGTLGGGGGGASGGTDVGVGSTTGLPKVSSSPKSNKFTGAATSTGAGGGGASAGATGAAANEEVGRANPNARRTRLAGSRTAGRECEHKGAISPLHVWKKSA